MLLGLVGPADGNQRGRIVEPDRSRCAVELHRPLKRRETGFSVTGKPPRISEIVPGLPIVGSGSDDRFVDRDCRLIFVRMLSKEGSDPLEPHGWVCARNLVGKH